MFGRLRQALEKSGFLEDSYIVVTSDHGLTDVRPDDRNSLGMERDDEPAALLRGAGFRPRPFQLEIRDDHDFNAVLAYQGGMAYVYVADRSTCREPGTTLQLETAAALPGGRVGFGRGGMAQQQDRSPRA